MDKKRKIFKIILLLVTLMLLWGLVWSYCVTKTVRKNNKDSKLKNQHAVVKNIIVTETQDEKKYWEFYAKSGEYDSLNHSVQLNDLIGNFYDKNEQVVVSFKSTKGTYDEKTKKVILNGDNLFVGKNDSQLYGDKLIWQGKDKDILADGNVQFIQEGKIVTKSAHAVFNNDLTNFKISGNSIVELYGDEKDKKKYTRL